MAGGTDLLVLINGALGPPPERVLDLSRLDELRGIERRDGQLVIGALTTYTELREDARIAELLPALAAAAATIGAVQIQNRGTIGGNVMNASPAGDTLPILLAADAQLTLGSVRGERTVPAEEFWTGYRTTEGAPDELLLRISVAAADRELRFRKIGTRRAQAISKVVMALAWRSDGPSAAWHDVRLALGSVAPIPIRARATEARLEGGRPDEETADAAVMALTAEIEPIDDVRSTAEYRRVVAGRVLRRLIRDEGGW